MKIDIKVDTSILDKNAKRYVKNLAYSTAQALNDAAKEAQRRIRLGLRQRFHIRDSVFMDRTIKIFAFANVNAARPYAEIGVDNKRRLLLSLFEEGGTRTAFVGRNVAIPVTGQAARPSVTDAVRPQFKFTALNFQRGPLKRTGAGVDAWARQRLARKRGIRGRLGAEFYMWRGAQRTFILTHSKRAPLGGVFQRVGPKRDDIRLIYSFKSNVRLRAALSFVSTSEAAFNATFQEAFYRRFYRLNA